MHPGAGGAIASGLFVLVWLGLMLGGLIGYVVMLVALWRGMKAHESIADSLREAIDILRSRTRP